MISVLVLSLIILPIAISLLLNIDAVQNFLVSKLTHAASSRLETEIRIDKVRLQLFNKATIDGLYIEDFHGDTLLYAKELTIPLQSYNPFTGAISLGAVELTKPTFNLLQDSTGITNLTQLIRKLGPQKKKTKSSVFKLSALSISINELSFRYLKRDRKEREYGVNFDDIGVKDFFLQGKNITVINDSITINIEKLALREKSGLVINNVAARKFNISGRGMYFERLNIVTPASNIHTTYLNFRSGSWEDYGEFITNIDMESEIHSSTVAFSTIAYFAPSLRGWKSEFHDVAGVVNGPISAMKGTLTDVQSRNTSLKVGFAITGIPDINKTRFDFDLTKLQTTAADIDYIVGDITGHKLDNIKDLTSRMGNISFTGQFNGLLNDFIANGDLRTKQGAVAMKLNFKPTASKSSRFNGKVNTKNFNIGSLLDIKKLEHISLNADVSGILGGGTVKLQTSAAIPNLYYNDYEYNDIALAGEFDNRTFNGQINSADPNLEFDFDGKLDFSDSLPAYKFDLQLKNAELHKIHFNKRDSISTISCNLRAEASGSTLDNVNGTASISNLLYVNQLDSIQSGDIRFVAQNSSDNKLLGMYSSFADVEFRGKMSYGDMFYYLKNSLVSYLPSISSASHQNQSNKASGSNPTTDNRPKVATLDTKRGAALVDGYYMLNVNVKEANNVAGIFTPGLMISKGSKMTFLFNPQRDIFSLSLNSEFIELGDSFISNLNLNTRNQADSISLFMQSDDLFVGGLYMPKFSIIGGVKNNQIALASRFNNSESGTYAMISTTSTLSVNPATKIPQLTLNFNPSSITSSEQSWVIDADQIVIDTTQVRINNFSVTSHDQSLRINGTASASPQDTINLRLKDFNIAPFSHLTDRMGYKIKGITNGYAEMASALKRGVLYASINLDSVSVNEVAMPNTFFESKWDFNLEQARFSLRETQSSKPLITGRYSPADGQYMADVDLQNINISLLDPILSGIMRGSEGSASAKLHVSNPNNKLSVDGTVNIPKMQSTVDFTNVTYTLSNVVGEVVNSTLNVKPTTILDPSGNKAAFEMEFNFKNFKNLTYNIKARPENLLALNTTIKENDIFYGHVYASGALSIVGNRNGINMDIVATTAGNSQFFLPLSSNSTVAKADFIKFESPKTDSIANKASTMSRRKQILMGRAKAEQSRGSMMNINMTLNAKPNAEMQLIIDPSTGDGIKGRGDGTINLNINPSNNVFTIYGDYAITDGSYRFNLRNIVSRTFSIEPGSTIQWTGDPLDAILDITAVYKLKASLGPLLNSNDGNLRRSTPVDCIISLKDRLMEPDITFDVTVPNADPEVQSLVAHALNTQEMKATQFLWLLTVKSFYSDNSNLSQSLNIGAQGAATGIDFLVSQFATIMSTDRFSLVPKYVPRSDMSSEEYGGQFYGELIKNRLILEGEVSYDTGNNAAAATNNASGMTGDATLSLILDQAGDFKAQAFTRTIDRFDENQGLQESGVGIFYRENFNSFKDLVKIFRDRFASMGRRSKAPKMDDTNSERETTKAPDTSSSGGSEDLKSSSSAHSKAVSKSSSEGSEGSVPSKTPVLIPKAAINPTEETKTPSPNKNNRF